jgi:N utilization substance protein A
MSTDDVEIIRNLFRTSVPEVRDGTIELTAVVRGAGVLTNVAVSSHDANIDPIKACVGDRGKRIKTIVNQLNMGQNSYERVDLFPWNDETDRLISNALQPAKILSIVLHLAQSIRRTRRWNGSVGRVLKIASPLSARVSRTPGDDALPMAAQAPTGELK